MNNNIVKTRFLKALFGDIPTYTFTMKVKDLVAIYYVAVRGVDKESGSVQRVLNARRISDIKSFVLSGKTFFSSFILNWTNEGFLPTFDGNEVSLHIAPQSAQVIDGQHRIAGLEAAMLEQPSVGEREILITMCSNLTTKQAAEIFLNINTEQKPVPKSLMYDLFGEVNNDDEHATNRAVDLARMLNDEHSSPLYRLIKFPGAPRGSGRIELSTFASAVKDQLKPNGKFRIHNLHTLDKQYKVIANFFNVIKEPYSKVGVWSNISKNPFVKAAGFNGAMDFLIDNMISKCADNKSFSVETMRKLLCFDEDNLFYWEELKGQDGKSARRSVKELLEKQLLSDLPGQEDYEF